MADIISNVTNDKYAVSNYLLVKVNKRRPRRGPMYKEVTLFLLKSATKLELIRVTTDFSIQPGRGASSCTEFIRKIAYPSIQESISLSVILQNTVNMNFPEAPRVCFSSLTKSLRG